MFSAILGLLNVTVFTRLFDPHDYGIYVLGMASPSSSTPASRVGCACDF